jgi:hypothetical protein
MADIRKFFLVTKCHKVKVIEVDVDDRNVCAVRNEGESNQHFDIWVNKETYESDEGYWICEGYHFFPEGQKDKAVLTARLAAVREKSRLENRMKVVEHAMEQLGLTPGSLVQVEELSGDPYETALDEAARETCRAAGPAVHEKEPA